MEGEGQQHENPAIRDLHAIRASRRGGDAEQNPTEPQGEPQEPKPDRQQQSRAPEPPSDPKSSTPGDDADKGSGNDLTSDLFRGPNAAPQQRANEPPPQSGDAASDDYPTTEGTVEEETVAWTSKERNIQNLVKIRRQNEARIKELEQQLASRPDQSAAPLAEEMQAKLNEAYDKLAQYDLRADPRFRDRHDKAQQAPINLAKRMVQSLGGSPDLVDQIKDQSLPDQLKVLQDQFPEAYQLVSMHLVDYAKARAAEDEEISAAGETRAQIEQQQKAAELARQQQEVENRKVLTQQVIANLQNEGVELFLETPGNEQWNQMSKTIRDRTANLILNGSTADHAKAMALGVSAMTYRSLWSQALDRLQTAERELADLRSADPGTGGTERRSSGGGSAGDSGLRGGRRLTHALEQGLIPGASNFSG